MNVDRASQGRPSVPGQSGAGGVLPLCLAGMIFVPPSGRPVPLRVHGRRDRLRRAPLALRGVMFAAPVTGISTGDIALKVTTDNEPAPELIEVPMMSMMVIATIWHVRSRQMAAQPWRRSRTNGADDPARAELFANATHELMTPITIARGHLDILGRTGAASADDLAETKQVIVDELKRIESMVGDLLLVGRLDDDAGTAAQADRCRGVPPHRRRPLVGDRRAVVDDRHRRAGDIPRRRQHAGPGDRQRDRERRLPHVRRRRHIRPRAGVGANLEIEVVDTWSASRRPRSPTSSTASTASTGRAHARRAARASGSRSCATSSRRTRARWRSSLPGTGGTRLVMVLPGYRR